MSQAAGGEAWILDGLRTPFGRHGGALARLRPDDMAADLIRALVARSGADPDRIEDVILGCACQAGEDGRNLGRNAALIAGLPVSVAGQTVNRLCGGGLSAVLEAARAVRLGEGDLILAGGAESMTRAPLVLAKAEQPFARAQALYDTSIGSRFPNPRLVGPFGDDSMPETADIVAVEHGISRAEADAYALASQQRTAAAQAAGILGQEIQPVEVPAAKRGAPPVTVRDDEHPRPQTTAESLATLRPLFEGGVVTAGNASGINDGAALLLVGTRDAAAGLAQAPLARIVAGAVAGVPPRVMGLGPVPAITKVLARAGLSLADMDVIEINEAFAAQVVACCRQLGLEPEDARLNATGGAIALGHPLGASGARLALTAARRLRREGGRFALVSLCIGLGQGIAMVLEAP